MIYNVWKKFIVSFPPPPSEIPQSALSQPPASLSTSKPYKDLDHIITDTIINLWHSVYSSSPLSSSFSVELSSVYIPNAANDIYLLQVIILKTPSMVVQNDKQKPLRQSLLPARYRMLSSDNVSISFVLCGMNN